MAMWLIYCGVSSLQQTKNQKKKNLRQQVGRAARSNPDINARDGEKTVSRNSRRHGTYAGVRTKKKNELRGSYGVIISNCSLNSGVVVEWGIIISGHTLTATELTGFNEL